MFSLISQVGTANKWDIKLRRWRLFWWFSEDFRRFSNSCPKDRQLFQAFSENSRRLPKFSEDNQRFPGKIQRCFNHRGIHLRKFLRDYHPYVTKATVVFSLLKITCYFYVLRYHVYARKGHLVFTGVYIIKSVILQYYVHVYVSVKI